jgi:hypothetical protein
MAFDWIESHRGLKDHPKTVMLTAAWNDRKPCVLGHLHELWWWTLEYAPDGIIRPSFVPQVIAACEWHGKSDRFWSGLVESGFLEVQTDGSYAVHDWDEYAVRRIQRYEKENQRKQEWRNKSGRAGRTEVDAPGGRPEAPPGRAGGASPTRARHQPDLPTGREASLPDQPPTPLPPDAPDVRDADAQGPSGTASAPNQPETTPPKWEEVAPGQHRGSPNGQGEVTLFKVRCPRCERSMQVVEYDEHVCELVPGEPVQPSSRPGNLAGFLPRRRSRRPSARDAAAEEQLQRMVSDRPTPEQIAAEAARLEPHDA